jgi:hypothetical protein
LPDKIVVFNGLHSQHGAENSLANTDGGMWETFAFKPQSGEYRGQDDWQTAIDIAANSGPKGVILVVKEQPDLVNDIQKRVFSVGSYLLVSDGTVVLSMTDAAHAESKALFFYFPEYTLDLGLPLGTYTLSADGVYRRDFERGLVLVNPSATQTLSVTLDGTYQNVIPSGGGAVPADGGWQGSLNYAPLSGTVDLPPISAVILIQP